MTSPDELGDRSPGKYYLVLEPDAAPLRRNLHEFASDAPNGRTIPELTRYTLSESLHQPGRVIDAIRQLRNVPPLIATRTEFPYIIKARFTRVAGGLISRYADTASARSARRRRRERSDTAPPPRSGLCRGK